jgi:cytochrome P450
VNGAGRNKRNGVREVSDEMAQAFADNEAERRTKIEADGEWLTEAELLSQCVLLLFGGHETTRNLIGSGVYTLLQHPADLAHLRQEPALIRTCIEELLRFQSPIQFVACVAKEDLIIEDTWIQAGETVLLMLGAANRDSVQFDSPDVFDINRKNNLHLAFGAGPHFCIGNQIARLEAQTFILRFIARFPAIHLATSEPQWAPNASFRGFKSFPLRLA